MANPPPGHFLGRTLNEDADDVSASSLPFFLRSKFLPLCKRARVRASVLAARARTHVCVDVHEFVRVDTLGLG